MVRFSLWNASPPARSASILRSALAACPAGASWKSSVRNLPAKRRWRFTSIAQAQKLGGMAAFVDAEHALDAAYAQKLGVDIDNLLVSQPDNGEQALEIAELLIRSNGVDVVVVDSVAALVPRAEIEGEMGDSAYGPASAADVAKRFGSSRAQSQCRKTCLIFINQMREKIGVMFGNPETTTGGRALKFYASVRLDIRRVAASRTAIS